MIVIEHRINMIDWTQYLPTETPIASTYPLSLIFPQFKRSSNMTSLWQGGNIVFVGNHIASIVLYQLVMNEYMGNISINPILRVEQWDVWEVGRSHHNGDIRYPSIKISLNPV